MLILSLAIINYLICISSWWWNQLVVVESHDQRFCTIFLHQCFLGYHIWTQFFCSASCQTEAFGFFCKQIAEGITRKFFAVKAFTQLLMNFFETYCTNSNIMRFFDSLLFLVYQNDTSSFTKAKSFSNSGKELLELGHKLHAQTINFFRPAMK